MENDMIVFSGGRTWVSGGPFCMDI
jgi:hypothetical protein